MTINIGSSTVKGINVGSTVIARAFLGTQKIYDQLDYPTLDLNFAVTKTLDPRITFTRASSGTYFDSNGVLQTATVNTPRFDHNPNTKESLGLLIEDQRTNSIRNNTMQGAVVGTPGTLPTNWSAAHNFNGLAREVVGFGEQSGIAYVDVRYSGTTTVAGSVVVQPEGGTSVVGATGQTWVASSFLAIVGGSLNGVSAVVQRVTGRGVDGEFLESSSTNTTLTGNIVRYSASRTMINPLTARVTNDIAINYPNGAAIDITLRIGMPQLEQGAFATSVIPTSGAAATRSDDVAAMTGANFSSWYNQAEGTLFAEYVHMTTGIANLCAFSLDNGTANEAVVSATATPNTDRVLSSAGGALQAIFGFFNYSAGQTIKRAVAIKLNDAATTANGLTVSTDNNYVMPAPTQLVIGATDYFSSSRINSHIRRIAYYPRRLANTELQLLTL